MKLKNHPVNILRSETTAARPRSKLRVIHFKLKQAGIMEKEDD
jgi:hypothetical protein